MTKISKKFIMVLLQNHLLVAGLVLVGDDSVELSDLLIALEGSLLLGFGELLSLLRHRVHLVVRVVVVGLLAAEDVADHLLVVRDVEVLAGGLVAEEVVDLLEARPGDGRRAHAARLVGGDEDAVARVEVSLLLEELLDAVHFPVPQGGERLVVGGREDERQVGLLQDGGTEDLAADLSHLVGQRKNVLLDDVADTVVQLGGHVSHG